MTQSSVFTSIVLYVTDAQLDVDECRPRPTERADCTSLTGECQNSAEMRATADARTNIFPDSFGRAGKPEGGSFMKDMSLLCRLMD